jgi:hypothetical protein
VEQEAIKENVAGLCSVITEVKSSVHRHEQAIDEVSDKQDRLNETVASLEAEIDRLEGFSRRNNIKFFGIPEANPGEEDDCAQAVLHVLNTYIPQETWGTETIERAHRIGRFIPNKPNPRPVIVKFQSWRDAIRVMKDRAARDDMEHDGLRVAQDLTRRQVETLKELRGEGKVAFYVNGKLKVRDDDGDHRSQAENNTNNVAVRGRGGIRGQRGGPRGRGGRGRGLHAAQQQHSASGRVSNQGLPVQPINETSGGDVTSSQGHPTTDVIEDRPRTRASSVRQVTMKESLAKGKRAEASNDTPATHNK